MTECIEIDPAYCINDVSIPVRHVKKFTILRAEFLFLVIQNRRVCVGGCAVCVCFMYFRLETCGQELSFFNII